MIYPSNPKANYLCHKAEIEAAVKGVLESGCYILGNEVSSFEDEFAYYLRVAHAVGVNSGTDALELALRACGVGCGDFVVTVSHTAVATVAAIVRANAQPVFADIDPQSLAIDPQHLEDLLEKWKGPRPKAIIPVHLYGQPVDMLSILEIARRYGLFVVEDCAQAHGAAINGRKVGAWGDLGCFSLYPTKNLGALGDGGIVVTNDDKLFEQVVLLREYGWQTRYVSKIRGTNSRLDEIQAAILRVKLRYLDDENERRRMIAKVYTKSLFGSGLTLPKLIRGTVPVFHQYVIRSKERNALQAKLKEQGIGTAIHYPVPIHKHEAYCDRIFSPLPLIHTEKVVSQILSLPMYPELMDREVERVIRAILMFTKN